MTLAEAYRKLLRDLRHRAREAEEDDDHEYAADMQRRICHVSELLADLNRKKAQATDEARRQYAVKDARRPGRRPKRYDLAAYLGDDDS
jgi:hypothetical protein